MKLGEFKKAIRPLIKECVKEVILEEGILSNVVSEVAKGLQGSIIQEAKPAGPSQEEIRKKEEMLEEQRQERIKRLNESAKMDNIDAFAGTREAPGDPAQGNPLGGVSPGDPGVDISGIVNIAAGKWKHLV